jgi:hypothetical protein
MQGASGLESTFADNRLISPSLLGPRADARPPGLLFDWLTLEPKAHPRFRLPRRLHDTIQLPHRSALSVPIEIDPKSEFVTAGIEFDCRIDSGLPGVVVLNRLSVDRHPIANMTVSPGREVIRVPLVVRQRSHVIPEAIAVEPHRGAPANARGLTLRKRRIVRPHRTQTVLPPLPACA